MLTAKQVEALNRLARQDPNWRSFLDGNSAGFGSYIQSQSSNLFEIENKLEALEGSDARPLIKSSLSSISPAATTLYSPDTLTTVLEISVEVAESFGFNSTLSIGTDADPELYMPSNHVDLNQIGLFISFPRIETSIPVKAFLALNGATSGAAEVVMIIR